MSTTSEPQTDRRDSRPAHPLRTLLAAVVSTLSFGSMTLWLGAACAHAGSLTYLGGPPEGLGSVTPTCPTNCSISVTSVMFQSKLAGNANPMVVPAAGTLVAMTINIGNSENWQADDAKYGTASFRLVVLAPTGTPGTYTIVAESPLLGLEASEIGLLKTYPIPPISVTPGEIAGIAVPSWLADNAPGQPGDEVELIERGSCPGSEVNTPTPWNPPLNTPLAVKCHGQERVPYSVALLPPGTQTVPSTDVHFTYGHIGRSVVLKAMSIGPLPSGVRVIYQCVDNECRRLRGGRVRHTNRHNRLTISNMNIVLKYRHQYHQPDFEFGISEPGFVGNYLDVRLSANGRGQGHAEVIERGCVAPEEYALSQSARIGC